MLDKFQLYDISESSIGWINNFLVGQKQGAHIDNVNFQWIYHGVPQGSTLGPLLLLLFIFNGIVPCH